jgi:endonuclease/exonuclease/phosphatase family metal-dependent hydrolase
MKTILIAIVCLLYTGVGLLAQDSLRIISYNIHHANPPLKPGVIDIDAIVAVLKKYPADIIALQEVDVYTRRSGNINEAKAIGDALGMQAFFGKAIDHDGGYYGVALLSKFPLKDTLVARLPMDTASKGEPRILIMATVKLPSGLAVTISCTHLDHRKDPRSREMQVTEINAAAKKSELPFIIAGDLNAEPASGVIQLLDQTFQRSCDECPFTFPDIKPDRTIDYIAFKRSKGIKALSHQVIPAPFASDHLPIHAVILFDK